MLKLYNTLTKKIEEITLLEAKHLKLYSCGPTVYSYAHIGNFRTFLTADLLYRTALALEWKVTYVSNITDVGHLTEDDVADASGEDKMAKALKSKEGESFANVWDLARFYTEVFEQDWASMNMLVPTVRPRATEHMRGQIQAIEKLIATGFAYETQDAVYFHVPSFEGYGKLSGNQNADDLIEGTREIVQDNNKKDPRDFALWKKDDKHLMQWFSPYGWGFPGWHLECSVMAQAYLGETIDVHAGGEDLIFPHHECEIAQSEALNGKPFANYWMHTRFLLVEGEKMSKSKSNFLRLKDLIAPEAEGGKNIAPMVLRYALISGQYGKNLNFTFEHLKACAKIVGRYEDVWMQVQKQMPNTEIVANDWISPKLHSNFEAVLGAMCNDLNTPEALAKALEGLKLISSQIQNLDHLQLESAKKWFEKIANLLGFIQTQSEEKSVENPLLIEAQNLAKALDEARNKKDFTHADELRSQIQALGFEVKTSREGTEIKALR